jgi:hypothetical protein
VRWAQEPGRARTQQIGWIQLLTAKTPSARREQAMNTMKEQIGFLVNWNVPLIKDGIKRMVDQL